MNNSWTKTIIKKIVNYSLLLTVILSSISNIYCKDKYNSVEHKNSQLNLYLDLIRYNCDEKIGILPYILEKGKGTYLEIGTGGDPVAKMLDKIPSTSDVSIIASDIDQDVLKSLPIRNPKLQKYIDAKIGPKLQLQKLNAIDMSIFEDNFFSGINASSVVHEIFSYENGFKGIENFFKEAFRTLKPEGILVYRDPEGIRNNKSIVSVNLQNKSIRLFFHIFIYKFLDKKGSFLGKTERKVQVYNPKNIIFHIYKKNESDIINLTYKQYLEVPSYDIDFNRNYKLTLPLGLYREVARHYLTYLHQCNPLSYIKSIPDINSDLYNIYYFAHSTAGKLNSFLKKYNEHIINGKINKKQKDNIERTIDENTKVLEFGIPLQFTSKLKEIQLRNLLKKHGLAPENYIIALNNNSCLLDYRIFGIFYDEINEQIFDHFNGVINKKDEVHAKWLKREGEEFYFYYSDDELIANIAKATITESKNENGKPEIFVLCPLSEKHNKFVHRICYTELLRSSLEVNDTLGYPIEVKDGKRVIHFAKIRLQEALKIYKKIIVSDPIGYPNLQEIVKIFESKYQK